MQLHAAQGQVQKHNQKPTGVRAVLAYVLLGLLFISMNMSVSPLAKGIFAPLDLLPSVVRKILGVLFVFSYPMLIAMTVYALARHWQMPGLKYAKRVLTAIVIVQIAFSLVFALLIAGIS